MNNNSPNYYYYLKLSHDRFIPNPFQFIIHVTSFNPTLYSLTEKLALNKLQINKLS
jgi:hypothetical protein